MKKLFLTSKNKVKLTCLLPANYKPLRFSIIFTAAFLLFGLKASAQETIEFKRSGDRKIKGINIIKKMNDVSVIQATVLFQNVTKRSINVSERNALSGVLGKYAGSKSGGASMNAELTAYLVFSDGEPTDDEYQKVVDDFYARLNEKMTQSNIKALPWENFASSKYYSNAKGEKEDDKNTEEMKKKGNAWKIYTANHGPRVIRYNPLNHNYNAPAVGGTVRLANYLKEANVSTAATLNIVVNFADILLEGEAHTGSFGRTVSNVKYDVHPNIRIAGRHNGGNQIFLFPTSKSYDEIYNATDVRATTELKAETSQDASKIQNRSWLVPQISIGHKHSITPFVVETTKKEYFDNVRNALDRYADELAKALKNAK